MAKDFKILEIALDNGVKHRCYFTLNKEFDTIFFEGSKTKKITPLRQVKVWAKNNGYSKIEVIAIKRGESNKTYDL